MFGLKRKFKCTVSTIIDQSVKLYLQFLTEKIKLVCKYTVFFQEIRKQIKDQMLHSFINQATLDR